MESKPVGQGLASYYSHSLLILGVTEHGSLPLANFMSRSQCGAADGAQQLSLLSSPSVRLSSVPVHVGFA